MNLLAFLREIRTTCLSDGVKLYLKFVYFSFRGRRKFELGHTEYLNLGKGLQFRKTSLFTTVPISSNGRLDQRAWFKKDILEDCFESGVHTLR